ncbi:MAG: aminoacyl-histidine dipeptidase [Peptoniphilus sp.]|nr:aminoacyl-histidine dipeptidase [Peptoniphilus sp.]
MDFNLEPKEVFEQFYEIAKIPRESGNEKAISDYLVKFAEDRGLEVHQDELWNVIIKKPATEGFENSDPVIIQGHMDMVCVKAEGVEHDFTKDPIKLAVDGDFLKAQGTTLGADNGIAVAYALAILDSEEIKHPPLEILITTQEETTMDGAAAVKGELLKGTRLLNIDSEEEGIFTVASAGGATIETYFDYEIEEGKKAGIGILIEGLKGGHSGQVIHEQRANANKVLFRILEAGRNVADIKISKISGGTKQNAIPQKAYGEIYAENRDEVRAAMEKIAAEIIDEYEVEEPGFEISFMDVDLEGCMDAQVTNNLIDYILISPDGVMSMSKDIEGLVESSLNVAVIEQRDKEIFIETSLRASVDSKLDYMVAILKNLSKKCQARFVISNVYPSWHFEKDSPLRDIALKSYEEVFGKEAVYTSIHAGLECGMLKQALPDCEMVSYGPNMYDVHSPKERVSISSVKNTWELTKKILENLK